MLIDLKQLKNLPVETESGLVLGHVHNLILETDILSLKQIAVNANKLIIISNDLLINADQIISITAEKIIVNDNVKKTLVNEEKVHKLASETVSPISAEIQN